VAHSPSLALELYSFYCILAFILLVLC